MYYLGAMISKTAILIDDDQDDLDTLQESINDHSSEIVCFQFKSAACALKSLLNGGTLLPDFIFIDFNMPLMNGEECARELRKNSDFDETTIIIMSTSMPVETATRLGGIGVNHTFQKPASFKAYQSVIAKIIPLKKLASI